MKQLLLSLFISFASLIGFSQDCPVIHSHAVVTDAEGEHIFVTYTADGTKHIEYYVYCDGTQILHSCWEIRGPGHEDGTFTSEAFICSGVVTYKLIRGTGTCINGTTCDTTITGPEGGPTPVTLTSFIVRRTAYNVSMTWTSSQELNLRSYEVQKSTNNSIYTTIAAVSAANKGQYTTADNENKSNTTTFYRLKMIDNNGKISYSQVRPIKGIGIKANFTIFPNPSFGSAKVTITDLHEPTTIQIIDNVGRILRSVTLTDRNSFEVNNLPQGFYRVKIYGNLSRSITVSALEVIR